MRVHAISEFGLDYESACSLTIPEFYELARLTNKKKEREYDNHSALLRLQTFYLLNVHIEKKDRLSSPSELWKLISEPDVKGVEMTPEEVLEEGKRIGESFKVGK